MDVYTVHIAMFIDDYNVIHNGLHVRIHKHGWSVIDCKDRVTYST